MSLWRQRLSVALQKAGCRFFRMKVAAALGGQFPLGWAEAEGLGELSVDDVECVPGDPSGLGSGGAAEGVEELGACN